jgi:hypothetical protein
LAKLLQAGRLVIERNQAVIDDPHRGEKGLRPKSSSSSSAKNSDNGPASIWRRSHSNRRPSPFHRSPANSCRL